MQRLGDAVAAFGTRWIPDALWIAIALTPGDRPRGPPRHGGEPDPTRRRLVRRLLEPLDLRDTDGPDRGHRLRPRHRAGGPAWPASARRPPGERARRGLLTFDVTGVPAFLHWGAAFVVGAFLAKAVAHAAKRRGLAVHFPLLVAAAYGGMVIAQTGLAGSPALLVRTPVHFLEKTIGLLPLSETIFQPYSLVFVALTLLTGSILLASLHPSRAETVEVEGGEEQAIEPEARATTPAETFAQSRVLTALLAVGGSLCFGRHVLANGRLGPNINALNVGMLMLGMTLHGSLAQYARVVARAGSAVSGIVLQYPFYAGILGPMAGSGLLAMIADAFVAISTPTTYPVWTMIGAALINIAAPSAGGQWAVQGPIAVDAAARLGLPSHLAVMTVMMGDQLTNLVRPFWLLPLLGITGLRVGQELGYTALLTVLVFALCAGCLPLLA